MGVKKKEFISPSRNSKKEPDHLPVLHVLMFRFKNFM